MPQTCSRKESFMISGIAGIRRAYQDDAVARQYVADRFEAPLGAVLHQRQVRALRQLLVDRPAADVLEIAPGPARLTTEISDLPMRLTLIDASAQMLGEAKRRLVGSGSVRHVLLRGDAFCLPLATTFDVVYSFRLIRHFTVEDRARLYREIRRVLRPGGWLMFDAVNEKVSAPLLQRAEGHRHYDAMFTLDALRAELRAAGFTVESVEGVQHHYPLLYQLQVLVAPRSPALAGWAMNVVDRCGGQPLEWIVTCRA
jgi:ubiquinone/menaquinone biosynthesis C-methylase UbiE